MVYQGIIDRKHRYHTQIKSSVLLFWLALELKKMNRIERKSSSGNIHIPSSSSSRTLNRKASTLSNIEKRGRKKDVIEKFIESDQTVILSSLSQLRHNILCEGLPTSGPDQLCPYRFYIWSILLRALPINTDDYVELLKVGESKSLGKISNDAFRTFKRDRKFQTKVSESTLIRLLNCYSLTVELRNEQIEKYENGVADDTDYFDEDLDTREMIPPSLSASSAKTTSIDYDLIHKQKLKLSPYVQGMNILAAPILYISKSEPEAFSLFSKLLKTYIPLYVLPTLNGALDGVKLVDLCLQIIDPKLFNHLKAHMLTAKIYALPSVLTLSACTPQLSQVLELWDFLFAFGCHNNIFFVIAQIILIRDQILNSENPMTLLREFPSLDSKKIIKLSLSFTKLIPDDLYDLIVRHPFDSSVSKNIDNYKI